MSLKPYYEDERAGIRLFLGDCREVLAGLPAGSVDLLLTDPPYGIGQAEWDRELPIEWFGLALPLLRNTGAGYIFGDALTLSEFQVWWSARGVAWDSRISWCYEDGPRNKRAWTSKHEDCLFWRGPDHVLDVPHEASRWRDPRWGAMRLLGDVWAVPRVLGTYPERAAHPTQKPEALFRIPALASSREGDLLLDAYAGSGTALVVAKQTGRRAIGIEREERFCELAAQRLQDEPAPLFTLETPQEAQEALSL